MPQKTSYHPGDWIIKSLPTPPFMIIPKSHGREALLNRIRSRLSCDLAPSLDEVLTAFQLTYETDTIEGTTDGLTFAAWPMGRLRRRYLDIAISWDLGWGDEKWEEIPGHIMASLKVPVGLASYVVPQEMRLLDSKNRQHFKDFFRALRRSRICRWYGRRCSNEFSLTLSGEEEFLEMASKVIPMMKENGLLDCRLDDSA